MSQLHLVPLGGGAGQVTTNMYLYQLGQDGLIVDCGIGFPEDKNLDQIIIPDTRWLKQNRLKLHGVVLTHGHDDHHAALPHLLPQLGYPPIYGSRLTAGFANDKLKDAGLSQSVNYLKETDKLKLGPFTIEPIHVTHSIPDSYHLAIHTPVGLIYHGSDFKFDLTPIDGRPPNFRKMVTLGQQNILCLLSDCLGSERPGFTPSESAVFHGIDREISHSPGRLIFTTMSSNLHRIQQAVDVAVSLGRKIAFIGRSMERNVQTAVHLGYLHLPKKNIIPKNRLKKIPDHRLCLIIAGSQGQETSSLTRYAAGTHRLIKPKPSDKVIFSADIIPGNEQLVYQTIDDLSRQNVTVVYSQIIDDLHASGHASAGEMQLLIQLLRPRYLYPIGGSFRHMKKYQELALDLGFRQDQVLLPQTGQIVSFSSNQPPRLGEVLSLEPVYIDQSASRSS